MRWSLRLLLSFALLSGLALPSAAQPAPAPPATTPADLQRLLDTLVAAWGPGAIGAVEDDGRTIRGVSGVGNLRTGQPPRPVQTFRVASQTKVFVATAVLQLVAEGRVGLDDPVGRYLPRRLLPDGGHRITVRQLLNHTSGLYDPQVEVYRTLQELYDRRFEHWTPREVMALANDNGLLFEPGTAWSYSNTNYVVAGLLLERVTGTSVARQLERRFIRPLGLRHTWFPTDTAALPPPRLRGYMPLDDQPPLVDADITRLTRRSSGPRGRWCPTSTTWTGSTTPCSTAACCPGGCWPRCRPRSTPAPPASATGWAWRSTHPALRGHRGRPHRRPARLQLGLVPAARRRQGRPRGGQHPPGPGRALLGVLRRHGRAVLRHDPGPGHRRRPGQARHGHRDPLPVACPVCAPMW